MADRQTSRKTAEHSRGRLLRALFDARFETLISAEMVPAIYRFGILVSALTALSLITLAFRMSWVAGVAWTVVLGPVLFLAMVVTMRVLLEFVLSVFRLRTELHRVETRIDDIAHELKQTDRTLGRMDYNLDALQRRIAEIQQDIPRLAFWRKNPDRNK